MPVATKPTRRTTPILKLASVPTIPFTPREPARSVNILIYGAPHRLIGPTLQPPPPGAFLAPAVNPPGHHYIIEPLPIKPPPIVAEPTWPRLASIGS